MITREDVLNQMSALNEERVGYLTGIAKVDGALSIMRHQLGLIDSRERAVAEKAEAERIALAKERSESKSDCESNSNGVPEMTEQA